jgi:hypothetical protein
MRESTTILNEPGLAAHKRSMIPRDCFCQYLPHDRVGTVVVYGRTPFWVLVEQEI